jgi:hypothetical protein
MSRKSVISIVGGRNLYLGEVFIGEGNPLALFVLVSLHDLLRPDLFLVVLRDLAVADRTPVALAELLEVDVLFERGGIERDRDVHQADADSPSTSISCCCIVHGYGRCLEGQSVSRSLLHFRRFFPDAHKAVQIEPGWRSAALSRN